MDFRGIAANFHRSAPDSVSKRVSLLLTHSVAGPEDLSSIRFCIILAGRPKWLRTFFDFLQKTFVGCNTLFPERPIIANCPFSTKSCRYSDVELSKNHISSRQNGGEATPSRQTISNLNPEKNQQFCTIFLQLTCPSAGRMLLFQSPFVLNPSSKKQSSL
jgi:hypothetical protein